MREDMPDLPCDIEAERYMLAVIMQASVIVRDGQMAVEEAAEWVEPGNLYRPAHQVIFGALIAMTSAEKPVDPVTLRAWIEGDGDMQALGGPHGGEYLIDLFGLIPSGSAGYYARIVLASTLRRRGVEEARRAERALLVPSTDPDEVMSRLDTALDAMRRDALTRALGTRGFREVTSDVFKELNPVIPGLLEAQDRVLVVAEEGSGKTTLAHQVGFAAAAGTHPFGPGEYEPQRVMIWDFENPERLLARRFRRLGEIASRFPGWDESNIRFELRPGGVTSMRDVFELRDSIRRFKPHLIVGGPIYKMVMGGQGDRDGNMLGVHNRVAMFFDQIRQEYGCALWLETHPPMKSGPGPRQLRPEGSGLWMRWPEFGLSLHAATKAHGGQNGLDVKTFRGHREEGREWPSWFLRAAPGTGWPWLANYDRGVRVEEAPPPPPDSPGWLPYKDDDDD